MYYGAVSEIKKEILAQWYCGQEFDAEEVLLNELHTRTLSGSYLPI